MMVRRANAIHRAEPGSPSRRLTYSRPCNRAEVCMGCSTAIPSIEVAYGNSQEGQGNQPVSAGTFGTPQDPLVGQRVGGVNSGADWGCIRPAASKSGALASAATHPAPTTWSPGGCATLSGSTTSPGYREFRGTKAIRTISFSTSALIRMGRVLRARFPTLAVTLGTALAASAIRRA
jgi:hypothetical protein